MIDKSGNAALASDISVMIGEAFSEAIVVGFQSCDDMNDPLSLLQQKQIISSCMSLLLHAQSRIECILELDGIARDCVGSDTSLEDLYGDVVIELDIKNRKVGFDE